MCLSRRVILSDTIPTQTQFNMANNVSNRKLRLATFNCKHFRDKGPKYDFIKQILNDNDVLLLQEHCLFQSKLYKLKTLGENTEVIGKSSMDENTPLEGRPYGGCAIVYKTDMKCDISEVKCDHVRLCGVLIKMNGCTILILNSYMPCDSNRQDQNFIHYMEVLSEVEQLIQKLDPTHVIFGGDLNTDFSRTSPHAVALKHFVDDYNMSVCIDLECADVPYTYIGPRSTSRIDHFIMSDAIGSCVETCNIIDNHLFSDHVPVCVTLSIDMEILDIKDRTHICRTAWNKASDEQIEQYKVTLQSNLENLHWDDNLFKCTNINCTRHITDLTLYYNNILTACVDASDTCIPKTGPKCDTKPYKTIPGWSDHIEHLRNESLMWHHYWRDAGRPHQGNIAEMHRITRARYHRAIRHTVKDQDKFRMTKMAEAISENRRRDLWKEVKKIKGRNNFSPSHVDGVTGDDEISHMFSNKYQNLYNSVPYDKSEMNSIKCEIAKRLSEECVYKISVADVVKSVNRLKLGKSDGEEGLNSDHIINGPHLLYVLLTNVFNCMVIHGISPESMILGTMVPIPKCKKKTLSCSDNYRAITLSSIVGKIFDLVVLLKEQVSLKSSDNQFGFKPNVSTTQCTFVMTETISYFNSRRSDVHVILLDATKAFDRVNYCKLFRKLLEKNMSPLVIRLLLFMYTSQKLQVRWGGHTGCPFTAANGVKQGGVLSPILFSLYMDGLLNELQNSKLGCHVGNSYVGCLAYADDLTLLAPTRKALQGMIDICEDYANDHDVLFNGAKSQYLVFKGRESNLPNCDVYVTVNNECLKNITSAVHLGHAISTCDKDAMLTAAIAQFWKSYNMFAADFGHIYSYLQCKLFKLYCCSFYGAPMWSFNMLHNVCVPWRKALRKIWRVSYMTHCDIIALLSDCTPLEISLMKRFSKFANCIMDKGSDLIRAVAQRALQNPFSVFCNNYCDIVCLYGSIDKCIANCDREYFSDVSVETISNVSVLREMIDIRDGAKMCVNLNTEDVLTIIDDICLN